MSVKGMTVAEAGRRGGNKTKTKPIEERPWLKKGGDAVKEKYGADHFKKLAQMKKDKKKAEDD